MEISKYKTVRRSKTCVNQRMTRTNTFRRSFWNGNVYKEDELYELRGVKRKDKKEILSYGYFESLQGFRVNQRYRSDERVLNFVHKITWGMLF